MANHNYWFDSCPTRHHITAGLIRNADILIIGGGIAGLSVLYQLKFAGIPNVYLVEENTIGFRSSGRSSGQLMLRGHKLFSQMPEQDGKDYLQFILNNNQKFVSGLRNVNFDNDLRECGGLRLAFSEQEMFALEKESHFLKNHAGFTTSILSQKEVNHLLFDVKCNGGLFIPSECTFNPYKIVNGLRDLIEKRVGACVMTGTQVSNVIRNEDDTFSVSIRNRGTIRAKKIVYCLNAYSGFDLLPELRSIMVPFRGQMIASDYLDNSVLNMLSPMSITYNNCREYLRLHNGRLLAGGMRHAVRGHQINIVDDGEISQTLYDRLRNFVFELLPLLKNTKFTHTWSGVMCSTPDGLPLIGQYRPNEFIFGGFNGYGFSHAIAGSLLIKDCILKNNISLSNKKLFAPNRFDA